jgi:hypothetical protein
MAVWRRPGLLRQRNPGVPSDVMVCLRVLARTGRMDCWRPCASFPPSSGYTAMSILCVARWQSARGMIEWMCTQERWNPEVAIIFGAVVRYRRAKVGSSHDDAHPDNSTLHTGGSPPHRLCGEPLLHIVPYHRTGHGVRKCSKCCQLFRAFRGRALFVRGMMDPYFSVGPAGWLFWNLMAHPLLVEEDSTSPRRWL